MAIDPRLPGNKYATIEDKMLTGAAQATMALAFEQRTANLIAFVTAAVAAGASGPGMQKQLDNIGKRLGAP